MSIRLRAKANVSSISALSFTPAGDGIVRRKWTPGGAVGLTAEHDDEGGKWSVLQRRVTNQAEPATVPPIVHDVLRSTGKPIDLSTRDLIEPCFNHDFSRVRLHNDSRAAESARAVRAEAYTVGHDMIFGRGRYRPQTREGLNLLMHELTHVVQQQGVTARPQAKLVLGATDSAAEQEAERVANEVTPKSNPVAPINGLQAMAQSERPLATMPAAITQPVGNHELHPIVRRRSVFQEFLGLFAGEDFDEETLHAYLRVLDETGEIENHTDSDNKARAIVNAWQQGNCPYILTPRRIILLIREMQSGFTGNEDEQAILELLERAENHHLRIIFGPNGINLPGLNRDFHGEEWDRLQNFYERRFRGGMRTLLQGRVNPQGHAVPLGTSLGERSARPPAHPGDRIVEAVCSARDPANCHTFETWIEQFQGLPTFVSGAGQRVIGAGPAPRATATDPSADPSVRRPTLIHSRQPYLSTDRFIDGPTDRWVRENLSPHLVGTAYQLPSDCADMAVILRHVWLVSHRRTEVYRGWLVGARLDQARSREILQLIGGEVSSRNVGRIVRPYTGLDGASIRSFVALQRLLHEGDVLVWEHQDERGNRTGGHTQTIVRIQRNAQEEIVEIGVLQGNQPIGRRYARELRDEEIERARREAREMAAQRGASERDIRRAEARAVRRAVRETPSIRALRAAPGRRIEVSRITGGRLLDNDADIWSFPTHEGRRDVLVAAGPPVTSAQPAARARREGPDVVRGLVDWVPDLRRVTNLVVLQALFEAALLEMRSLLEAGHVRVADRQAAQNLGRQFARTAGERLWYLARRDAARASRRAQRRGNQRIREQDLFAEDLAEESHYRPLRHMSTMLQSLRGESYVEDTRRLFTYVNTEFVRAARGFMGIDFRRRRIRAGTEVANVLMTGFDPFMFARRFPDRPAGPGNRPRQVEPEWGRWNPSGAAVLQLDGRMITAAHGIAAAVESIVFPVSYGEFRAGMVESVIGPNIDRLDAAITVSMDPRIPPTEAPIIERYAVGVHRLNNRRLEPIPPTPTADTEPGPAIIEARGDLPGIAREAGLPRVRQARGRSIPGSVRSTILFKFVSAREADRALSALSLPLQNRDEVVIDDPDALAIIVRTMERGVQGTGITFCIGAQRFQVRVLSGPGGSFLSNEVSYRVLRMSAESPRSLISFHVHTPRGEPIPQEVGNEQARRRRYRAIQAGRGVVRRLVTRLIEIIKAVARRVVARRQQTRSQ